jgi:hypothetical protein
MQFSKTKQYLAYRRKGESQATVTTDAGVSFSLAFFDAFEHDKPEVVLAVAEFRGFAVDAEFRELALANDINGNHSTATGIEQQRASELAALGSWWDNHPGIEVAEGVRLPIDKASVALNGVSAMSAMQTSQDAALLDASDRTVSIPADQVPVSMVKFQAQYAVVSAEYDQRAATIQVTHDDLLAAI